jgi:hypothetical protein
VAARPWLPAEHPKICDKGLAGKHLQQLRPTTTLAHEPLYCCCFKSSFSVKGVPESPTLNQHTSFGAGGRALQIRTTFCPRRRMNAPAPMP